MSDGTKQQYETREQWLMAATAALRPLIKSKTGLTVPQKTRVACGFPVTGGTRRKNGGMTIGQCLKNCSSGGYEEIFIHPIQDTPIKDDGSGVLETVTHELLHAALDAGVGHRAPFARACKALGLEGKPTSTHVGEGLRPALEEIATNLGPYPHHSVEYHGKKQSTRLIAVRCTSCECVVRMTTKWLDEVGAPTCGCGSPMEERATMDENLISLKSLEHMFRYQVDDPRFEIMYVKDRQRGDTWYVIDFQEEGGRQTPCEDKQDALDTIEAIQEGMHVYEDVDYDEQSDDDVDVDEFDLNHEMVMDGYADLNPHFLSPWEHEVDASDLDDLKAEPFGFEQAKGIVVPEYDHSRDNFGEAQPIQMVTVPVHDPTETLGIVLPKPVRK